MPRMVPATKHRPPVDPFLICCGAILVIASASILIRLAQVAGTPSPVVAASRLVFASLILVPLAFLRCRAEFAVMTGRDLGLAGLSGGCLALHFFTWITSLELTSLPSSVVIMSTAPIWVALAAPLVLKERAGRSVTYAVVLVAVGGSLVGLGARAGNAENPLVGNLLALAGALSLAGYFLAGRRLRARISLLPYVAITYGAAAVVSVLALPFLDVDFASVTGEGMGFCVLIALFPQLVGHSTFNWGLRWLPAATVSVLMLGEPIGAMVLAVFVFGEWPEGLEAVGITVILAALVMVGLARRS